ncbi:MAG: hypothetical protein ABW041_01430 [Dehalococcoides mccartyi]|nr:hypothetical protein DMOBY_06370 [Dehalococcoides mccartyi]
MREKPNKDFSTFKKEFEFWMNKFGCTDWQVIFKYENLDNANAEISRDAETRYAVVTLASNIPDDIKKFKPVSSLAKHEAIHLLLSNLYCLAQSRHVSNAELATEEEKLVVKLVNLIL